MADDVTLEPMASSEGSSASILLNMESMIKSTITSLNLLEVELDKHQSMLNAIFEQDATFQEHSAKVKEATKIRNATKQEILKQTQAAQLNEKVKSMKSEIKEQKSSLSDYLREYQRMSGVSEIESEDGELMEIVYTAKLVRRSSNSKYQKSP